MATAKTLSKQLDRMRKVALALPEATEEVTWGTDINFRVRKKIFAFPGDGTTLTVGSRAPSSTSAAASP